MTTGQETSLDDACGSLRPLLDGMPQALLLVDGAGRVRAASAAAAVLLGYAPDALAGADLRQLFPEGFAETAAGLRLLARRADDSLIPVLLSRGTLAGSLSGLYAISLEDARRHLALEQALRLQEAEPPDRMELQLHRKNEELREQYRRMQESSRLKSEFLANMSHELRTPLNAIIGFAEILHDGRVGVLAPDHREYIGDILTSSRHLLQLINNVLDLAKIEAGKMEFRPSQVELEQILGEVRDVVRSLLAQKRLQLELRVDPKLGAVLIDPAKLRQVLYNYLSNAIKFTPEGGRIAVRVDAPEDGYFRLEVEDTGVGIRADELSQLFVEFRQLGSTYTKRHDGTGLGLALTRRIVEAQGGHVGVESEPGRGSRFFATLPTRPAAPAGAAPEPLPTGAGAPVLVVEDDARDREWIAQVLAGAGYAVDVAVDGSQALEWCRKRAYAALTVDLLLPDMTGWELLRAIRMNGPNRSTPAIVLSVVADRAAGSAFAIRDYLTKPADAADLLAALKRAGVTTPGHRKVLVLDGDPQMRASVCELLQRGGYEVHATGDRFDALQRVRSLQPDALVLDLLLDGSDAFAFLAQLRNTPGGERLPIFVCTEIQLSHDQARRLGGIAHAVLRKGEEDRRQLLAELRVALAIPTPNAA